jgi:hypothetical protein
MDIGQVRTVQALERIVDILAPRDLVCVPWNFRWSAEIINDGSGVLIKYNYERDFASYIKSLKLTWSQEHSGWLTDDLSVIGKISKEFPEWKLISK